MTFTLLEKFELQKDAGGAVNTEWNAAIDRCIQILREHTQVDDTPTVPIIVQADNQP